MAITPLKLRKMLPKIVGNRGRTPEVQRLQSRYINFGVFERWVSILGGTALSIYGFKRGTLPGYLLGLAGAALMYRGATQYSPAYAMLGLNRVGSNGNTKIMVDRVVTINKPVEHLYSFWRDFENLPRFMTHLESVDDLGEQRSHWVARAPFGKTVAWDSVITGEKENEYISWRSLPTSDVKHEGTVRFKSAPHNRGTEVHVTLKYHPPAGSFGAAVAKIFGEEPQQQVTGDLRRFKQIMEGGTIPTGFYNRKEEAV